MSVAVVPDLTETNLVHAALDYVPRTSQALERYVLGFAFTADMGRVALIRKLRPAWQKGKLNGIGGHIESGEMPDEAMAREFREETGVSTIPDNWEQFGEMSGPGWFCYLFTMCSEKTEEVRTVTDERVGLYALKVYAQTIPNLQWLIPAAIEAMSGAARRPRIHIDAHYV